MPAKIPNELLRGWKEGLKWFCEIRESQENTTIYYFNNSNCQWFNCNTQRAVNQAQERNLKKYQEHVGREFDCRRFEPKRRGPTPQNSNSRPPMYNTLNPPGKTSDSLANQVRAKNSVQPRGTQYEAPSSHSAQRKQNSSNSSHADSSDANSAQRKPNSSGAPVASSSNSSDAVSCPFNQRKPNSPGAFVQKTTPSGTPLQQMSKVSISNAEVKNNHQQHAAASSGTYAEKMSNSSAAKAKINNQQRNVGTPLPISAQKTSNAGSTAKQDQPKNTVTVKNKKKPKEKKEYGSRSQFYVDAQQDTSGETCKTASQSPEVPAINKQLCEELSKALGQKYNDTKPFVKDFPTTLSVDKLGLVDAYDMTDITKKKNATHVQTFEQMFKSPTPGMKLVIQGAPGFGKTTLCSFIAYQWSLKKKPFSSFKLCILVNLPQLPTDDIQGIGRMTSRICSNLIGCHSYAENDIRELFLRLNSQMLVILDGYDDCDVRVQNKVIDFLDQDHLLEKATIVVTTKSTESRVAVCGNKILKINGFSFPRLEFLLKKSDSNKKGKDFFSMFTYNSKIEYLTGMSPVVTTYIWKIVVEGWLNKIEIPNLSKVLENVLEMVTEDRRSDSNNLAIEEYSVLFLRLGKLFLEALVEGYITFSESLLKDVLNASGFEFIVKCHIIHCVSNTEGLPVWSPTHKVWLVFFATHYLKHCWEKCKTDEEKLSFLDSDFCFGACTGDYVVGRTTPAKLYYVGLLPEIVLNFGSQHSLSEASLEMYYDVEGIEGSSAFDSVNLLVRVSEPYLERFHFRRIADEDEGTQILFASILDVIECDATFRFFCNYFEEKYFAVISLAESEGNGKAMTVVFRAKENGVVDRAFIEFPLRKLEVALKPLAAFISRCLPDFTLDERCQNCALSYLLYNLVLALLNCKRCRPVIVTCGEKSKSLVEGSMSVLSFEITPAAKNQDSFIYFSCTSFGTGERKGLKKKEYLKHRDAIQKKISDFMSSEAAPVIYVNLM